MCIRKFISICSLFALGLFVVTNSVSAQEKASDGFFKESKFYLGAGAGYSISDTGVTATTGTADLDEEDIGFKGFVGFQFNKYVALEGFYANLGEAELTGNNGDTFVLNGTTFQFTANNVSITAEGTSAGVGAVFSFPINEMFSPFVKGGAQWWEVDASVTSSAGSANLSNDGVDPFFGGGLQFNINENIAIRAEYERFVFDDDEVDFFSASFVLKF